MYYSDHTDNRNDVKAGMVGGYIGGMMEVHTLQHMSMIYQEQVYYTQWLNKIVDIVIFYFQ